MFVISTKNKLDDNYLSRVTQNGNIVYFYCYDDKKESERIFSKIRQISSLYEMKNGKVKLIGSGIKK